MFGLEEWADAFDAMHEDNMRAFRRSAQSWVDSEYKDGGEGVGFYAAAVTAGVGDALFDFVQTMGGGMVDTLRIGEGVKEGGWGYLKDGLRVVSVVGGALRVARVAGAIAVGGGEMSCAFTSATKAMRFSGSKYVIPLSKVAGEFYPGMTAAAAEAKVTAQSFQGLSGNEVIRLMGQLRTMGAEVESAQGLTSLDEISALARQGRGPVVFGVQWTGGGGHIMMAYRTVTGGVRFADQFGNFQDFASLTGKVSGVLSEAAVVKNAMALEATTAPVAAQLLSQFRSKGDPPTVHDLLGLPLHSVPPKVMQHVEKSVREQTGRPVPSDKHKGGGVGGGGGGGGKGGSGKGGVPYNPLMPGGQGKPGAAPKGGNALSPDAGGSSKRWGRGPPTSRWTSSRSGAASGRSRSSRP